MTESEHLKFSDTVVEILPALLYMSLLFDLDRLTPQVSELTFEPGLTDTGPCIDAIEALMDPSQVIRVEIERPAASSFAPLIRKPLDSLSKLVERLLEVRLRKLNVRLAAVFVFTVSIIPSMVANKNACTP